jgi:hypothetical protein
MLAGILATVFSLLIHRIPYVLWYVDFTGQIILRARNASGILLAVSRPLDATRPCVIPGEIGLIQSDRQ